MCLIINGDCLLAVHLVHRTNVEPASLFAHIKIPWLRLNLHAVCMTWSLLCITDMLTFSPAGLTFQNEHCIILNFSPDFNANKYILEHCPSSDVKQA